MLRLVLLGMLVCLLWAIAFGVVIWFWWFIGLCRVCVNSVGFTILCVVCVGFSCLLAIGLLLHCLLLPACFLFDMWLVYYCGLWFACICCKLVRLWWW